jgi:A/G-specific adenine glycosylase
MKKMKRSEIRHDKKYKAFTKDVLGWYTSYGRHDLPWRKSITPYKILVSEIMLQQTQVSRVISKYELWIKMYPTLEKLSHATLKDVLSLWKGLGYQRRAKALLAIAGKVRILPRSHEELKKLPGIGEYTASAIEAFAYNQETYVLETNIRTALIEAFHKDKKLVDDTLLNEDLKKILPLALKEVSVREWYWALMDYGAHLKKKGTSHNAKVKGYTKQTPYEGSLRKLRAEVLFAIAYNEGFPNDERLSSVLSSLKKEGFIRGSTKEGWTIA